VISFESDWTLDTELGARLVEFNEQRVGPQNALRFMLSVRDDSGRLVAGLKGATFWNALYVHDLWVDADQRKHGHGSALVSHAEQIARERGCEISILSTFSFQAPRFYERLGYHVFGEVTDLPPGHTLYWFSKRLALVDDMSKRQHADTSVRLPADFEATIKALLKTPPPPAGDPSTRKQKPKKKPAKKASADEKGG
jgi:GNAT superfamily N-acetyltransferase